MTPSCDVAIVGCGPVGATLANLCALQGLRTLVVEREEAIHPLPRAIHFDGECMRVFQTIGIADALAPDLVVSPGMRFVDATGHLLIDWSRPTDIGPQGWHASYRFHQPTLEAALRRRLQAWSDAHLSSGHEVVAIEPHDTHVELTVRDRSNGGTRRHSARYVVGCDGARSIVRRTMGTVLDDLRSHERWLVIDVILQVDRPDLGDHAIQFCDPARPATYVRGPGQRRRWEFMLFPDEDVEAMCHPDVVRALLSRWLAPHEAVLERPAAYTFHSVVARGWWKDRLLIAGDAAHQTPPFLGQGMCAGIRDAANLAWKLADVIRGRSTASLLSTYESERSPHVRSLIDTAVRLGRVIQTSDPAEAATRDARMIERPEVFATPQPRLGPGAHDAAGPAGSIGEQGRTIDGTRIDDRVGYRTALIVDANANTRAVTAASSSNESRDDIAIVAADSPSLRGWLARLDAVAVVVRPDRYVAGIARTEHELPALIRRYDEARTRVTRAAESITGW